MRTLLSTLVVLVLVGCGQDTTEYHLREPQVDKFRATDDVQFEVVVEPQPVEGVNGMSWVELKSSKPLAGDKTYGAWVVGDRTLPKGSTVKLTLVRTLHSPVWESDILLVE